MLNEHGKVGLKVSLTGQGTVSDAVVEKSSGSPRLDDAAVKYAKSRAPYRPPGGRDMPAERRLIVSFELR